ncbi:MAG: hypothetical protein ACRETA_05965 [Gammaproteobacteria bacterium]
MKAIFATMIVMLLVGCATIIGSNSAWVSFRSQPPGAKVVVTDESGATFTTTTPSKLDLTKANGHYFGKEHYTASFTLPGYQNMSVPLTENVNGWYFGNILFGGVIGMVLVDPWNGGMYSFKDSEVSVSLCKITDTQCVQPIDTTESKHATKVIAKSKALEKELHCTDQEMKDGSCQ